MNEELCPFCGAYSPDTCELEEDSGYCLWEDMEDEEHDDHQDQ